MQRQQTAQGNASPCPAWDPPVLVDGEVGLPGRATGQALTGASGHWCNYDVIVKLPPAWLSGVTFELRSLNYNITSIIDRKTLLDAQLPFAPAGGGANTVTPAGTAGDVSCCLFSVRGRPTSRLDLVATNIDESAKPRGLFFIRAWGDDAVYGDRSARLVVDPFAGAHQQIYARTSSAAPGTFPLTWEDGAGAAFTVPPGNGRMHITSFLHSNQDTGGRRLIELQSFQPAPGPAIARTKLAFLSNPGADVDKDFTYPLRSERGAQWQVVIGAGAAALHVVSLVAFVE